jgi:hypothetical protein
MISEAAITQEVFKDSGGGWRRSKKSRLIFRLKNSLLVMTTSLSAKKFSFARSGSEDVEILLIELSNRITVLVSDLNKVGSFCIVKPQKLPSPPAPVPSLVSPSDSSSLSMENEFPVSIVPLLGAYSGSDMFTVLQSALASLLYKRFRDINWREEREILLGLSLKDPMEWNYSKLNDLVKSIRLNEQQDPKDLEATEAGR